MSDVQRMEGSFDPPETARTARPPPLTGFAPVGAMRSYPMEVVSYTRGRGHLNLTLDGYRPCHNAAEVIEAVGYEPEHDLDNPADSVFCSHGAGFVVPWEQVRAICTWTAAGATPPRQQKKQRPVPPNGGLPRHAGRGRRTAENF